MTKVTFQGKVIGEVVASWDYAKSPKCGVCGSPEGLPCTKECDDDDVDDVKVKRKWCNECSIELCCLDDYYGTDPDAAKCCVKCR